MPTALTHAVAGLGVGALLAPPTVGWPYHLFTLGLGVLPDLDVLAFSFGVPYRAPLGHRGLFHSLFVAALVSLLVALAAALLLPVPWWALGPGFFAALASHTLLDALTDGGLGVALFWPLSRRRYFFPWRPIRVSPIGLAALSRWGLWALASEVLWIWLPLALAVTLRFLVG
jgi:inner membrane protein